MIMITNPHFSQYRVSRDSLSTQLSNYVYRILDNGTSIDLESEIPFAKEYWAAKAENPNGEVKDLTIAQAPFYQRFYED